MELITELEEVNTLWNVRDQDSHIIVSGNETKAEIVVDQNYEVTLYNKTGSVKETQNIPTKDQLVDVLKENVQ